MTRGPDAAAMLERAVTASATAAGCPVTIDKSDWARWSSATFSGVRHRLTLTGAASPALDAWILSLPESQFALRGHLIADIGIARGHRSGDAETILLEVLSVEER